MLFHGKRHQKHKYVNHIKYVIRIKLQFFDSSFQLNAFKTLISYQTKKIKRSTIFK